MRATTPWMVELAVLLRGDSGMEVLRFLRSIYYGSRHVLLSDALMADLMRINLVSVSNGLPTLTSEGYLVGNIAKEYCNWVDNNRAVPEPKPSPSDLAGRDVLDLGCSFGRWLWYFQLYARSALGIEQQSSYIEIGRVLAEISGQPTPAMIAGNVDNLARLASPQTYDFIFSRLVFNHLRVRVALQASAIVLRPGGVLWIQVERPRFIMQNFRQRLSVRWLIDCAFAGFGLLNSALFNMSGVQLQVKRHGRMHSYHQPVYPSFNAWKRELRKAGFSDPALIAKDPMYLAFQSHLQ